MSPLYEELTVWRRHGEGSAVLYRCLKDVAANRFAVQSADFFSLPVDGELLRRSEAQFLELLMEMAPSERCAWFDSLEQAIAAHDRDFA